MLHIPIWKITYLGRQATEHDKREARKRLDAATRASHPAYRYDQEHIHDNGKILEVHRSYKWSLLLAIRFRVMSLIDRIFSGIQISNA